MNSDELNISVSLSCICNCVELSSFHIVLSSIRSVMLLVSAVFSNEKLLLKSERGDMFRWLFNFK